MSRFLIQALLWVATIAPAAAAQEVCAARQQILDSLAEDYSERPSAMGMTNGGGLVEVYTARDGTTWTILVTRSDGNSCIVAAGEMWTPVPQQTSSKDDTI